MKEIYPEYSEENELNLKEEFVKINGPLPDFDFLRNIEIKNVVKNFALVIYILYNNLYKDNKEKMLLRSGFVLPLVHSGGISYFSYKKSILTFGQNPSNYIDNILASTRKCKTFAELVNEIFENNKNIVKVVPVVNKKNEICSYKEVEEEDDFYLQEIATILEINGFNFYEDISKTDIITALQTRSAFGKYNGDIDKNNLHKAMADIVISILSKKCKDLSLKKQEVYQKETKVYIDENKKVQELELKNKNLSVNEESASEAVSHSSEILEEIL